MVFESDVEARLVRGVEKLGGMCLKFRPDDHEGFPDRLVLLPGREDLWVELKRPEGCAVQLRDRVRPFLVPARQNQFLFW